MTESTSKMSFPNRFDFKAWRPEPVIREDLRQQLEEMFKRWEEWKCQS